MGVGWALTRLFVEGCGRMGKDGEGCGRMGKDVERTGMELGEGTRNGIGADQNENGIDGATEVNSMGPTSRKKWNEIGQTKLNGMESEQTEWNRSRRNEGTKWNRSRMNELTKLYRISKRN